MCEALGYPTPDQEGNQCENLLFLNLRGNSGQLNQIEKSLILLCERGSLEPSLIVADSYYMLGLGNENDATQITQSLLKLGRIAEETGAGVILTHHTPKGDQSSRSINDRASGSGAFGRYVDVCAYLGMLDFPQDGNKKACRLEYGKTRHEATPPPVNLWFEYPRHEMDTTGTLESARYAENGGVRHGTTQSDAERKLAVAYTALFDANGKDPTLDELVGEMGVPKSTVERWITQSSGYERYKPDGERAHRVRPIS